ncbi:hypothetical protein [Levilactobacillus lindianensis]|uniref:hypothetical protein n=1 Tax=Levilactobacillus lindianensis TaxID=2486018 RepID=UPI000F74949A|nr:hypothetical protein [Levilactobacillus lindianensis]
MDAQRHFVYSIMTAIAAAILVLAIRLWGYGVIIRGTDLKFYLSIGLGLGLFVLSIYATTALEKVDTSLRVDLIFLLTGVVVGGAILALAL